MPNTADTAEKLLAKAKKLVDPEGLVGMTNQELRTLIQRESARRLAQLGGSEPQIKAPPRRR